MAVLKQRIGINPPNRRSPVEPKKYNITYDGQGNAFWNGQIIGNMFTNGVGKEINEYTYLENWAKEQGITLSPNKEWLRIQPGYVKPTRPIASRQPIGQPIGDRIGINPPTSGPPFSGKGRGEEVSVPRVASRKRFLGLQKRLNDPDMINRLAVLRATGQPEPSGLKTLRPTF